MSTQFICLAVVIVLLSPSASAQWVPTNGQYGRGVLSFTETPNGVDSKAEVSATKPDAK